MGRKAQGPVDDPSAQKPVPATASACGDTCTLTCPCCLGGVHSRKRKDIFKTRGECPGAPDVTLAGGSACSFLL